MPPQGGGVWVIDILKDRVALHQSRGVLGGARLPSPVSDTGRPVNRSHQLM